MTPSGSIVAYACAPGQRAAEIPGQPHGLFTKHLLRHIEEPGLSVSNLFIRVGKAVNYETSNPIRFPAGPQNPYVNHALRTEDACLVPPKPERPEASYPKRSAPADERPSKTSRARCSASSGAKAWPEPGEIIEVDIDLKPELANWYEGTVTSPVIKGATWKTPEGKNGDEWLHVRLHPAGNVDAILSLQHARLTTDVGRNILVPLCAIRPVPPAVKSGWLEGCVMRQCEGVKMSRDELRSEPFQNQEE
eukprot:448053-Prymnesium_polylepis.1